MSLAGINVQVDGYNLRLPQGTGIKTYGQTLVEALSRLGANVDVLFDRETVKHELLQEVLFFDVNGYQRSPFSIANRLIKGFAGRTKAERITRGNFVLTEGLPDSDYMRYTGVTNAAGCYDTACWLFRRLRKTTKLRSATKTDIWHSTYPLPMRLKKARMITTVHDLIPLILPYTTLDDKRYFFHLVGDSIKRSNVIIAVSENTKNDILKVYDVNPDKIVVTYQPTNIADRIPEGKDTSRFLRLYGLKKNRYFLFVGAIEPKKNMRRLLKAYSMLNADMPLVVVGKKAWMWENELGEKRHRNVLFLNYVPRAELPYFYAGAYATVFPSVYEGFGLPLLEAMTLGCPVIGSDTSSIPEVCGDAALYINPQDEHDICAKMEQIMDDTDLRGRLSLAALKQAKYFSMENYMERLTRVYEKALT